jgi:branched-chain amino acid transport system substrate-binding protein
MSNPVNRSYVARSQQQHRLMPDKFMALGAASLQVWAMAANEVKSLDKEKVARRIRGGTFKNTILGDMNFAANGQLSSRHYVFSIKDQKMVVEPK